MNINTLEGYLDDKNYRDDVPNEYLLQVSDNEGYTISPVRGLREDTWVPGKF